MSKPLPGKGGCTCGLGPRVHSTGCPAYRRKATRGSYHVESVSHHYLRRRARARAFAYDAQGGGRDAVVKRSRGPLGTRWKVEYRRYDSVLGFASSSG